MEKGKFRISAKEGYIEIEFMKNKIVLGCELQGIITKAFVTAERIEKRKGKGEEIVLFARDIVLGD